MKNNERQVMMKIAIVGLKGSQIQNARKATEHDLVFVPGDKPGTKVPNADHIFVMTRWSRYQWTENAYKALPRERVHLHGGGMSSLYERMNGLNMN